MVVYGSGGWWVCTRAFGIARGSESSWTASRLAQRSKCSLVKHCQADMFTDVACVGKSSNVKASQRTGRVLRRPPHGQDSPKKVSTRSPRHAAAIRQPQCRVSHGLIGGWFLSACAGSETNVSVARHANDSELRGQAVTSHGSVYMGETRSVRTSMASCSRTRSPS